MTLIGLIFTDFAYKARRNLRKYAALLLQAYYWRRLPAGVGKELLSFRVNIVLALRKCWE